MTERVPWAGLLVVFWLSGAAALVYEVLWLKQLGRLFGVTAYASSTTLAVFFLGLSLGGWIFSRIAPRLRNPLRTYAWLELGIAAVGDLLRNLHHPIGAALSEGGHEDIVLCRFVTPECLLHDFGGTQPPRSQRYDLLAKTEPLAHFGDQREGKIREGVPAQTAKWLLAHYFSTSTRDGREVDSLSDFRPWLSGTGAVVRGAPSSIG